MDPLLEDENASGSGFDIIGLLRMVLRRKWLFIVPFVLCLSMAGVAIKTMTPIYYSAGQIRVVIEESMSRLIGDGYQGYSRRLRDVQNEVSIRIESFITSPKFLENVVESAGLHVSEMGLEAKAPGTDDDVVSRAERRAIRRAASRLRQQMRIESTGHLIFDIGATSTDPQRAYLLARSILDRFLAEDQQRRREHSTTTLEFLQRQRQRYEQDLAAAESALADFQRERLSATLAGNPINSDNLADAEESLQRLRDEFDGRDALQMRDLEAQATAVVGELPPLDVLLQDDRIASLLRRIGELEFDEVTEKPSGRDGSTMSNELGRLRIRLMDLVEAWVATSYPNLGVLDRNNASRWIYFALYRDVQQRVIRRLAGNIEEFREFTIRQPEHSTRLAELQQEVADAREMVNSIERDIVNINLNLEASQAELGYRIEVRRDPTVNWDPIEPNKLKLAFFGGVLSAAIGMGLVILSILLDRSFTSVESIERNLGLPVIGTLPIIEDRHFASRRRRRILRWTILVVMILAVAALGLLYVYPRLT
jgi:uncharacterized protein involved in exopolysaccharide biosynthesis